MSINTKLTQEEIDQYYLLIGQGYSQRQCCGILGVSRGLVQHYLKRVAELENEGGANKPKILFYDIETTLAKSYHFGQWKQNIGVKQQVQEGHLLSHAWAWNNGDVVGSILTREEILDHDPERLVLEAWALFDNADVIVAH